jgi:hypothetical protein
LTVSVIVAFETKRPLIAERFTFPFANFLTSSATSTGAQGSLAL